jgi:hypothetical protein
MRGTDRTHDMAKRSILLPLALGGAVLALALVFNPSPERHRESIRQAVGERSPVARLLGVGSLAAFGSRYHSLALASYTTAGDRVLSIGLLGVVHVLN